jgi:hypothetical protein
VETNQSLNTLSPVQSDRLAKFQARQAKAQQIQTQKQETK